MLKIGWSSRDFTPARPAMLQGQMHIRIASSALDPLICTACAIENTTTGDAVIFVSMDLAYIANALVIDVRKQVHKECPGIPVNKIILNATHTHTSLVYDGDFYKHPGGDVMTTAECLAWLTCHAVAVILDAWKNRKSRMIGNAFGHAVVGHNRYAVYTGGAGQMYGATSRDDFDHIGGYEDHSLDMLFTWDPNGLLSGVMLSIPCPSQVTEHLEQFSADYWHDVRIALRARFGAYLQVLPMCGAAGDQSPHFLLYNREEAEMRRRCGLTERQVIARRVVDAVEQALVCTPPMDGTGDRMIHVVKKLKLTALKVTREHCQWAENALAAWRKCNTDESSWFPVNLKRVIHTWRHKIINPPFPMELHVIRIGDVVIATNPFELFLDYGLQIKACSPAAQTILMQLAGRGMYLPTSRALGAGGYGANPVVSHVGPEGGRELVASTLQQIRKLFR